MTAPAGRPAGVVFDAAPVGGAPPDLVRTVKAPEHVLDGQRLRRGQGTGHSHRLRQRRHPAAHRRARRVRAAQGRSSVPVARTFPLDDWRTALEPTRSHRARGELVLRIGRAP
ncbi:MAG: hypothetical protein ACRDP6_38800 [Actinoallomurus sp.]